MTRVASLSNPPALAGTLLTGSQGHDGPLAWFAQGLERTLRAHGHTLLPPDGTTRPRLVVNFTDANRPRPFRRHSQGTFVIGVVVVDEHPQNVLPAAYPILVRSLSNLLIYMVRTPDKPWTTYFVTLEQGYYTIDALDLDSYFEAVYDRMEPLATSHLVVNNIFTPDLPESLWDGDEQTESLRDAGRKLDAMNLLPSPFPVVDLLPPRQLAHVKKLFNLGGLSYGNLSARSDGDTFWMSASGVDKGNLQTVGRDILLITGYNPRQDAMKVSVPPHIEPRRVSVDAIEHWMIYSGQPEVGAIVHVHAWMEGVPSTHINYPCGTVELAREVAQLVREQPDPSRAVVGLRNHGLTITGPDMADIMRRIDGKLLPQVPMS